METIETMRKAIVDAIEKDVVSMRDLMDTRAVNKIIEGTAKTSTIELAYSRLSEAISKHQRKNQTKLRAARAKENDEQLNKVEQKSIPDEVFTQMKKMQDEINELRLRLEGIQSKKAIQKQPSKGDKQDNILGFSIRIENTWTSGKQYTKYYAIKRIQGRHHRIYIGNNPEQAEQKIKAYAEKHSLLLPVV